VSVINGFLEEDGWAEGILFYIKITMWWPQY